MINRIKNLNIVLGVSGGIAAYKSVELLRLLEKSEANVRVIMTKNAESFVAPLTFEALSGNPVCTSLFEKGNDSSIRHIEWAETSDAVIIAPATANILGKLANGIADDALSTFMLAVTSPVILCPSMNTNMYLSKAVQRNLKVLQSDGHIVLVPGSGELACGTTGPGRLPEPEHILDRLQAAFAPKDFAGKKILVTAGPTQEPIDPVRFISNPSSGKMGYAIAKSAEHRGGDVILVAGPTHLPDPSNIKLIRIQTAEQMADAVFEHMDQSDIIIKSAAVSDYKPVDTAEQKIKKQDEQMTLFMQQNVDILKALGQKKENRFLVGFAAETETLEKNALKKLKAKNLDMIVGNLVNSTGSGFGTDTNKVTLFFKDGSTETLEIMGKDTVSNIILDRISGMLDR